MYASICHGPLGRGLAGQRTAAPGLALIAESSVLAPGCVVPPEAATCPPA